MNMNNKTIRILILSCLSILAYACSTSNTGIFATRLKTNYKEFSTGVANPVSFSWELESGARNQSQSAWQIIISDDSKLLNQNEGNIWNSGKINSGQSIGILIDSLQLKSGTHYFWKVKVWDKSGIESDWSDKSAFVTALFDSSDWDGAKWISLEEMDSSLRLVPGVQTWQNNTKNIAIRRPILPLFRKEFEASKSIESAYLFICGLGQYEAHINGKQIGNFFLTPGWTQYDKTCLYNTYDITQELQKGKNAIGVIVGNGFYNINNERYEKLLITYGMPKMIAKIEINYSDGTHESIVSGDDWKTSPSPITYSSMYGGETYDARLEQAGWDKPGFNDASWQNPLLTKVPTGKLKPEASYPVKAIASFSPKKFVHKSADTFMIDFGQNASGIVRIKVKGKKGDTVRIFPSELYYDDFSMNQRFTGSPYYYDYILKGDGIETWQPRFTYYGFRYVHVIGAEPTSLKTDNTKPELLDISLLHTSNSAPRTGSFWCSNPLFNKIDTLIQFGIQSNIQSVATDCPHREKLGWIEQTYLMGNSIQHNFEVYHLYRKLVNDMIDSQHDNGMVPTMVPQYIVFSKDLDDFNDSPEWGSAIIMLPWLVYNWYGDISLMEKAWPNMLKYVHYLDSRANENIINYGLGDWYDVGPEVPGFSQLSPIASTATSVYFLDYKVLAQMAEKLGKEKEAEEFKAKAEQIRLAYNKLLFHPKTDVYATGSQSAMAIPLSMGMVDEFYKHKVLQNLVDSILANHKALTAGDIGYHYLIDALTKGDQSQLVYDMNNRDDVPGYGYQIKKGATALTESWDALPQKSNNHLMLGHIEEWLYTGLGGIRQEESSVAYKDIIIHPTMVNGLEEVKTSYHSPYGTIKSEWKNTSSETTMHVSIPVNTTAKVFLPAKDINSVKEGSMDLKDTKDIEILPREDNFIIVEVGSGDYQFKIQHSN